MQISRNPDRSQWKKLLQRPYVDNTDLINGVQTILNAVKQHRDEAVWSFTKKFDGVELKNFTVSADEIDRAPSFIPEELKKAIQQAGANITTFHRAQLSNREPVETMAGIQCWQKNIPIEKVGLYVPGGTAPLFSTVLMLGIPAKLAACKEIILCTPCNTEGEVHPAILY